MKIVKNVVLPSQTGKSTLTSLLTANTTPAGNNKFSGRRILMTKAPDGTTRLITGTTNILPKAGTNQQSLIKVQTSGVQQIQLQQPGNLFKKLKNTLNSLSEQGLFLNTAHSY